MGRRQLREERRMHEPAGTLRRSALELEPMVSFSGNQEDVRLRRVLELLPTTNYVDVGAGDPVDGSVTYWLYTQGWRGVLVEPGTRGDRLTQVRPEDLVVAAAVGSGSGEVVLYETFPDAGMSTMRTDRLPDVLALGQTVRERRMPVLSLTEVFERASGSVSVLSVDVEGAEGDVLGSLDWEAHRPVVVVVEAILPWQAVSTRPDFEHHLQAADYPEVAFDGVNAYYVDRRFPGFDEVAAALAYPVSLLDRWEPHTAVQARKDAEAARAEFLGVREEVEETAAALSRARAEGDQARKALTRSQDEADELRSALDRARAEAALGRQTAQRLAEERDRGDDLEHRLAQAEQELDARARRLELLSGQLDEVLSSTTWRYASPVAHVVASRAGRLRRLRRPDELLAQVRRQAADRAEQALMRRAGPAGRALLAVQRHTHPAFLAPAPERHPVSEQTWRNRAEVVLQDDDVSLRARLESREGLRDPLQRSILLAALAESVAGRGGKSRGRSDVARRSVLVDARSLQEPGLALRGVGQYARELVRAAAATGARVHLLVDPALPELDGEPAAFATVEAVTEQLANEVGWLIQPSPMTHDQWPLTRLLDDDQVWCTAMAHDLIPSRYPDVYLPLPEDRLRYEAREQALRLYDEVFTNSHATLDELTRSIGAPREASVVWPVLDGTNTGRPPALPNLPDRYLLVMGGNEHRKNVVAAFGAAALARVPAVLMGWSGQRDLLSDWARDAGLADQSLHVLPYVDETQASGVRQAALLAVVPSFAEGLSLPVVESLRDGCPVVASSAAPHLELLGSGPWIAHPARPDDMARAVRAVLQDRSGALAAQREHLAGHVHSSVPEAVAERHRRLVACAGRAPEPRPRPRPQGARPSVGVVTPWPPQRTGIGDYSAATLGPLAQRVDLTLHVSASARPGGAPGARFSTPAVFEPTLGAHDALLTVMGNSHFHLPGLEVIEARGGVVLCHDVRQVELNSYLKLQDAASASRPHASDPPRRTLRHELDAVATLGFDHIAQRSRKLLFHSAAAARRVARETGATTAALPFVPYRAPTAAERTPEARAAAREQLGLADGQVHLALLGGVDVRTKAADVIVEAQAWLRQWGHPVVLHVVGGVDAAVQAHLEQLVAQAGTLGQVRWHGHVSEEDYRRFLLSVDLGVQLRTAALLTLSGAVADLASFGVPSVATLAMAEDMGLPAFVRRVPDDFSSLLVAEELEAALSEPAEPEGLEAQRQGYLREHSVQDYVTQLLRELELEDA
jgi:FkbM family methyltransferase